MTSKARTGQERRRRPHPRGRDDRLAIERELARRREQARTQRRNRLGQFG